MFESRIVFISGFFLVLFLSWLINSPLQNLPFILDDHSNLSLMSQVDSYDDIWGMAKFVLTNSSGTLGRPLSMASFLVDDFSWPSSASAHRATNIAVHLINLCLVVMIGFRLSSVVHNNVAFFWLTLGVALFWSIAPANMGPVISVVQRMTSLSSLFMLLAIYVFSVWRLKDVGRDRFATAFVLLIILFIAACLSKETAVLLPGYILILEFLIRKVGPSKPAYYRYFVLSTSVIYLISILAINVYYFQSDSEWFVRDFTAVDRILSQLVIIPIYAAKLLTLRVTGTGLMVGHSDLEIWFSTINVLYAAVFWFVLVLLLVKGPLFLKGCMLWFINGHLLESVAVPLELYFEHRNYIASIGLYSAVAYGLYITYDRSRKLAYVAILIAMLLSLNVFFNNRISYTEIEYAAVSAVENPYSSRAWNNYIQELVSMNLDDKVILAADNLPSKSRERVKFILGCRNDQEEFDISKILGHPIDASYISFVRAVIENTENGLCAADIDDLARVIQIDLNEVQAKSYIKSVLYSELAFIYSVKRDLNKTMQSIDSAIALYPNSSYYKQKAQWALSAGLDSIAIEALKAALDAPSRCKYWTKPCDLEIQQSLNAIVK
ncbi:hypothetical protein [Reinekea blandensis]|nr:hypothetical protein [Reinekea blandensis]